MVILDSDFMFLIFLKKFDLLILNLLNFQN